MKLFKIAPLIFLILLTACSNFDRLYSESQNGKSGTEITATGVFDLKVICMNAGPENIVEDDHCEGYFSESAQPLARSVEVDLMICSESLATNCIDPLPKSAPPEVIVIRDNGGKEIGAWSSSRIRFITKRSGKKTRFQVREIY